MATNPNNKNFLSPIGFQFAIQRLPNVNYFCTSATIPQVSMGETEFQNPFVKIPLPGEKLTFGELNLRFRVDEDMQNYLEIYKWLISAGFPETFEQYKGPDPSNSVGRFNQKEIVSDGTLVIHDSKMNPKTQVTFKDMFPVSLSELKFDTTMPDVSYIQSTVTFRYSRFTIESL